MNRNRKKLIGILMAMALIVCESISVLAAGSKPATPIYSGEATATETVKAGTTVYYSTGTKDKAGVTVGISATGGGSGVGVTIDVKKILSAINSAAAGSKVKLPKDAAKKVGCKFKRWTINGKKVTKLTPAMIQAIGSGTLELKAEFKVKKYKVQINGVGSGVKIKKKQDLSTISGNSEYMSAWNAAMKEAESNSKVFLGFATKSGSTTADFTEALSGGGDAAWAEKWPKNTVTLYPVYADIKKKS